MPRTTIFFMIGLLAATVSTGLAGIVYYAAFLHFMWYLTALYGSLVFTIVYLLFISYAMFKAALLGESEDASDEPSTY